MGGIDDTSKPAPLLWWGYVHVDDTFQTKRYFCNRDIAEAEASDFVKSTCGPFEATCRGDAIQKVMDKLSGKVI